MYLPTLVQPMSMLSFNSSPWKRGAPQSGLSRHIGADQSTWIAQKRTLRNAFGPPLGLKWN